MGVWESSRVLKRREGPAYTLYRQSVCVCVETVSTMGRFGAVGFLHNSVYHCDLKCQMEVRKILPETT